MRIANCLRLFVVTLLLAMPLGLPGVVGATIADDRIVVAQNSEPKKRSLFDILFGRNKPATPPKSTKNTNSTKRKSSPSITTVPTVKMIEKEPDAKTLLVVGDSLAIDLAKALDRFYASETQLAIVSKGVGSSGFVRDDYFDWNAAIDDYLVNQPFDLLVVAIGINDRQEIRAADGRHQPLTPGWRLEYERRLNLFLSKVAQAQKPVVWMGLPPMRKTSYSKAMSQISSMHRLAAFANGAEYVDIYERFVDEDGNYSSYGPDLNGQNVLMRKSDGIHLSSAGSDKVAFFVDKVVSQYYRGGEISVAVVDPLEGTDAFDMLRPPFQGIAQIRKLELAGAIRELGVKHKSRELVLATKPETMALPVEQLFGAPEGRADAFGVGVALEETATE